MSDEIENCNTEFGAGCSFVPDGRPHACAYLGPHRVHECARCGAHAPNPAWVEPPDLAAEVVALRRQLDEVRDRDVERSNLAAAIAEKRTEIEGGLARDWPRIAADRDSWRRVAERCEREKVAAEADRDRLLVVYRAVEDLPTDLFQSLVADILADPKLFARKRDYYQSVFNQIADFDATLDSYRSAAPAEPAPHAYTSTACIHGLHDRCRRVCKYGDEPCLCRCDHTATWTLAHDGDTLGKPAAKPIEEKMRRFLNRHGTPAAWTSGELVPGNGEQVLPVSGTEKRLEPVDGAP